MHRPRLVHAFGKGGALLALGIALTPTVSVAQSTRTSTPTVAAVVSLTVRDADVTTVLQHIARVANVPLAISAGVDARIDLVLDRVPAEVAMRLALEAAHLTTRRVGEVTVVEPRNSADHVASAPKRSRSEARIQELLDAYATPQDRLRDILQGTDRSGTPPGPPRATGLAPKSAETDTLRPVPDFDGLPPRSASAGEVLIWVPRALLFPVHLVMNYLVRIPVVWTLTRAEEHFVFKRIERFISFRDGKSIIFPTFLADFGLRPSVGLTNNNRDLFFEGNDTSLFAAYGGKGFIRAGADNTTTVLSDDSGLLRLFGHYTMRPDQPFYGHGPFTDTNQRFNYKIRQIHAGAGLRAVLDDLSWVRFNMTFKDVEFGNAGLRDDPTDPAPRTGNFNDLREVRVDGATSNLADRCGARGYRYLDRSAPFLPCGYSGEQYPGYRVLESRLEAKFDTRHPDTEFRAGSGFLAEGFASFEFDPANVSRNWLRFGGEVAGFWDFTGVGHTLALRVFGEFTERTGAEEDPIPFTELPSLGGLESMRGFLPRRFIGDSAFMTEFSYRYPVWSLLDAELFASVGNTFDGYLEGFSFERLHLSSGISLRTSFTRASSLQLLVAFGTNRFEELERSNFEIDSIRLAFGYVQGF